MRDIEGFHLFLEKVEQDQMQRLNAKGEPLGAAIDLCLTPLRSKSRKLGAII